ncbi:MAG: hypothetical protein M1482_00715, partial [Chloroflexi bacterium]|nr:hypothetical protein [Chloroflexota bacterium]
MKSNPFTLRPSLAIFSFWIFLFALVLTNGYALSFVNLSPDPAWVTALLALELALLAVWLRRQRIRVAGDPLELAGLLLVVILTWLYFIYPSWPTLFPPTYSADASIRYSEIIRTMSGHIIADYPGGPAFLAAMTSYLTGWLPIRIMHLLGAAWMALTAGGIYGVAHSILPPRRWSSAAALFAPFALFVPWDYFGGILIGAEYFWPQVLGQLFLVAFVWFLAEELRAPNDLWSIGMGFCLVGISVSFPLWLALPAALRAWAAWDCRRTPGVWRSALIVFGLTAVFWGVSLLTGGEFIPRLARFGIV